MATEEAEDDWCPPTFVPSVFGRTLLAWLTIAVANHNTWSRTLARTWLIPDLDRLTMTSPAVRNDKHSDLSSTTIALDRTGLKTRSSAKLDVTDFTPEPA
jgi:hypothetical protein